MFKIDSTDRPATRSSPIPSVIFVRGWALITEIVNLTANFLFRSLMDFYLPFSMLSAHCCYLSEKGDIGGGRIGAAASDPCLNSCFAVLLSRDSYQRILCNKCFYSNP